MLEVEEVKSFDDIEELFMLFPVEIERIPFDNKYTPEILRQHIDTGVLGLLRIKHNGRICLLYTSPSPRDGLLSRMPSSA